MLYITFKRGGAMKGYRLLGDIREEFKVSYQTLDKHLNKLNIPKNIIDRRVYIKENEYNILYNSLSNSRRIKKISEIDYAEFETESHKEELLKQQISFLEKRVKDLEGDIYFKNKEIENFHGIVASSSIKIEGLERQVKLLEQAKEIEIQEIEEELNNTKKLTYKLEDAIKIKEIELENISTKVQAKEEEILKERASKEILIEELNNYKNRSFIKKLKDLFV